MVVLAAGARPGNCADSSAVCHMTQQEVAAESVSQMHVCRLLRRSCTFLREELLAC